MIAEVACRLKENKNFLLTLQNAVQEEIDCMGLK